MPAKLICTNTTTNFCTLVESSANKFSSRARWLRSCADSVSCARHIDYSVSTTCNDSEEAKLNTCHCQQIAAFVLAKRRTRAYADELKATHSDSFLLSLTTIITEIAISMNSWNNAWFTKEELMKALLFWCFIKKLDHNSQCR